MQQEWTAEEFCLEVAVATSFFVFFFFTALSKINQTEIV
jgi:hypothetical protein